MEPQSVFKISGKAILVYGDSDGKDKFFRKLRIFETY